MTWSLQMAMEGLTEEQLIKEAPLPQPKKGVRLRSCDRCHHPHARGTHCHACLCRGWLDEVNHENAIERARVEKTDRAAADLWARRREIRNAKSAIRRSLAKFKQKRRAA